MQRASYDKQLQHKILILQIYNKPLKRPFGKKYQPSGLFAELYGMKLS